MTDSFVCAGTFTPTVCPAVAAAELEISAVTPAATIVLSGTY
jgi:hypothetical protein